MSAVRRPGRLTRLVVLYTTIRVAVFLAVVLVLIPVHMNVLVRLAVAFVGSAIVSYPLARRQRVEMANLLEERRRARIR